MPEPSPPWHALGTDDVEERLGTSSSGLGDDEVAIRSERFGPNALKDEPPAGLFVVILRQFKSPLIYILLLAAAVTIVLGEFIDAGVIAAVLALNAVIGVTQERRAEGAVRALMQLVVPRAKVVRSGHEQEIDSRSLVPGDVVVLEPGSRVPADLRLTNTNALQIDESLLTGESSAVTKYARPVAEDATLADRSSMAYTGAVVTMGRGRGAVVGIGASTQLGSIAGLIRDEQSAPTPLQQRMAAFTRVIGLAVGASSLVAFVSGVAMGSAPDEMFLTAVALAVAAIPEGLPVAFTITLALGVRRMARRNAVIRRLPAVETLGSTTVIGSDKTGTLTQNRMEVQAVWAGGVSFDVNGDVTRRITTTTGEPVEPIEHPALHETLLTGVLTNEASRFSLDTTTRSTGDPTELALLASAFAVGIEHSSARDSHPMVAEIPFEPEDRYSASVRVRSDGHVVFAKGAPERILEMCSHVLTGSVEQPIDPEPIHAAAREMAAQGLRVLAMASRRLAAPLGSAGEFGEPEGLVFMGLQGMHDPPRSGVREAISLCREAGVRVVMITGDHAETARAIALDLGIASPESRVLTGADLATLADSALCELVPDTAVFARVAPEEKLRIVRALERNGEVVAVTGDGINDAPALKAAAIGVAMGRSGTDVAREASDMVLTDDNFVSITAAVEEGRVTFDNIRNVTFFLVSTGAATILAILASVWMQWPLLLLPAQLLWLNLVTNGLQDVALAFEPGVKGVLKRPPRPRSEGILSLALWERVLVVGIVMAIGTLVLFNWELSRSGSLPRAQTVALTTMVVFMAFHAGNARSEHRSVLRMNPFANRFLLAATIGALGVHAGSLYLAPTQYVLRVEPLDFDAWWRMIVTASTVLVAVEVHKVVRRRRPIGAPVH